MLIVDRIKYLCCCMPLIMDDFEFQTMNTFRQTCTFKRKHIRKKFSHSICARRSHRAHKKPGKRNYVCRPVKMQILQFISGLFTLLLVAKGLVKKWRLLATAIFGYHNSTKTVSGSAIQIKF